MPVCAVVCLPGICRGIQPLLLAHPCVCMGKDKNIQCILEGLSRGRKKKRDRGRSEKLHVKPLSLKKKKKSMEGVAINKHTSL